MILEAIVKAIRNSKITRYKIAQDTGIDESVLHRIVNGGSCSVRTADKLCEYLGLKLVREKRKRRDR